MSILNTDRCKYSKLIQQGKSFRMYVPFLGKPGKVHIMYVLDGYYNDEKLIVYRVFGKHKRWWHEYMMRENDIIINIKQAKNWDKK